MTDLRDRVRDRYARAAKTASEDAGGSCCSDDCCSSHTATEDFGTALYRAEDLAVVPKTAAEASLGCGNPTAVAELSEGETVLDLGSGAGIDVFLSARRVGPEGFVYGVDMTDEMLDLARKNQKEAAITNVEFRKGYIEDIPIDDEAVDVVISNCVINLSADKPTVITEMYRVLRPGGRIGISDVVADNHLSPAERMERGSWVGCIAGALSFAEYEEGLHTAGFADIEIEPTHAVADGMHSAIIRATKPA
jgi:SAM-dependent methyltransferase